MAGGLLGNCPSCATRIIIYLESETDVDEDGGFFSVVNCFASISLGMMGSDHVRWEAPCINVLLDDSQG